VCVITCTQSWYKGLGIDERIILKRNLMKHEMGICTEFIELKKGTRSGLL